MKAKAIWSIWRHKVPEEERRRYTVSCRLYIDHQIPVVFQPGQLCSVIAKDCCFSLVMHKYDCMEKKLAVACSLDSFFY